MSDFDDHNQRWNDDLFSLRNDGPYGGLSLNEVLQNPILAEQYGLYPKLSDGTDVTQQIEVSTEVSMETLWIFVLIQAIGVGLILLFTFMD